MVRKLMIRIDQMQKKLKELQKEIEEFQTKCKHEKQQIKFDEKNCAKWYCDICGAYIRMPSKKELDDWISR